MFLILLRISPRGWDRDHVFCVAIALQLDPTPCGPSCALAASACGSEGISFLVDKQVILHLQREAAPTHLSNFWTFNFNRQAITTKHQEGSSTHKTRSPHSSSMTMPWPRPRRALLCFLCIASCESVVSSFTLGVASVAASVASTASGANTGRLVRGGCTSRAAANVNNDLGMTAGLQDSSGAGRKSVPAVQAVAEVDTARPIAGPAVVDKRELGEVEEEMGTPPPPPPPPLPPSSGGGGEQDARRTGLPYIQDGESVYC